MNMINLLFINFHLKFNVMTREFYNSFNNCTSLLKVYIVKPEILLNLLTCKNSFGCDTTYLIKNKILNLSILVANLQKRL